MAAREEKRNEGVGGLRIGRFGQERCQCMGILTDVSVINECSVQRTGEAHHMMYANHGLLQDRGQRFHGIGAYTETSRHPGPSSERDAIYVLDTKTGLFKGL